MGNEVRNPSAKEQRQLKIKLYMPQMVLLKMWKSFWDQVAYLSKSYVHNKCSQDMSGN